MRHYILDDDGNHVPLPDDDYITWAKWYEKNREKWQTVTTHGRFRISTIFLGLDHSFGYGTQPILWETMAFNDRIGWSELPGSSRDYTRAEALETHAKLAKIAKLARLIGWKLASKVYNKKEERI